MSHWTDRTFWTDASWRAFRTFCQTLGALFGASAFNVLTVNWLPMLSVAAGAALQSLIMSIDRDRAVTAAPTPAPVPAPVPVPPAEQPAPVVLTPLDVPSRLRERFGVSATNGVTCGDALP